MSPRNTTKVMLYDSKLQELFEDWIIEAKLKMKFNVVTYYIETRRLGAWSSLLMRLGLKKTDRRIILHVLTNQPAHLIGPEGRLFESYRERLIDPMGDFAFDAVELHEVKDQERLFKGIKRKLRIEGEKRDFEKSLSSGISRALREFK